LANNFFVGVDHYIFEAAESGDVAEIEDILSRNPKAVNLKTTNGNFTPLMFAKYHPDLVEFLISKGADVDAKDGSGMTALMMAIPFQNNNIISLLILHSSDVNTKDLTGMTPLIRAAIAGNKDTIEKLISKGADIKAKDEHGKSSLQYALEGDRTDIVDLLREHGAKE